MTAYLTGDGSLSALLQLKVDAAYVPSESKHANRVRNGLAAGLGGAHGTHHVLEIF